MLSHYGHEHYCPLSLLRVLGASMIQVFQYSEEQKEQQAGQQQQTIIPASGVEGEGVRGVGVRRCERCEGVYGSGQQQQSIMPLGY